MEWGCPLCYDPPNFSHLPYPSLGTPEVVSFDLKPATKPSPIFPSATPPELMGKQPLPLNPLSLSPLEDMPPKPQWTSPSQVVMTRPPSPAISIYPSFDLPPTQPPTPIPWSTHRQEYSLMEQLTEQPEDPDSPMEDMPPIEPEPTQYEHEGLTHILSSEESPIAPWQEYLTDPSPVSCKHSLSPTSPSSVPICQCTSREGSYQSITPAASSPIASTSPQS